MKYIIYGTDKVSERALDFLWWNRIDCFADDCRKDEYLKGKKIISFSEMKEKVQTGDYIIVVASYSVTGMVKKLEDNGIAKYFVFDVNDFVGLGYYLPAYLLHRMITRVEYTKLISDYQIKRFKRIVIYGGNPYLQYLISEISIQNSYSSIVGIIEENGSENVQTAGIPVVKMDDVWDNIDCLIVNKKRNESKIFELLDNKDHQFRVISLFDDVEKHEPAFYHPELEKIKNTHCGERCFLIGNGPSLAVDDLDTLYEHGEYCIGYNKIYKVYDRTKWRADMIAMTDPRIINGSMDYIDKNRSSLFISDEWHRHIDRQPEDVNVFHMFNLEYEPNHPDFSEDITKGVYWGNTVMYDFGFQFAHYMGFNRIYVIGADNCNSGAVTDKRNHFIDNYFDKKDIPYYENAPLADFGEINTAYNAAELYSRRHGFRIYNATRGGKLEAFERVDFDSLF